MHDIDYAPLNIMSVKRQKLYAFAFSYILSFLPINICINALTTAIGFNTSLDTLLFYGMLWILIFCSVAIILMKEKIKFTALIFTTFFIVSYALSAISPDNARYMFSSITDIAGNPLYITFIYTIPTFIIALYIRDAEILTKIFKYFSYIVVVSSVAVYFLVPESSATQYMSLSYNMLAQLVFLAIHKPRKYKILHYLLILLGAFVVFFGGARGATVGLVIGLSLYLIANRGNSVKKIFFLVCTMLLIVFALIFLDKIVVFFQQILQALGIESRTFDLILNGVKSGNDITSGRLSIYKSILSNVNVIGHGFYYDRVLLGGSYCHNLFLELLLNFGWLFGIPICLIVIAIMAMGLFSNRSPFWKFVIVMIPTGFISAMLSGSYLSQFPGIYALIAICLVARKEQKEVLKCQQSD